MDEKLNNELIDIVLFSKIFGKQFDQFKKIRELFSSIEEYMVLHCITAHNIKDLILQLKKIDSLNDTDFYITGYFDSLKSKKNSGVSVHGISRDTEIPRTTVKRWTNSLIERKLIDKNLDGYLVPTGLIRSYCREIRELATREHIDFANFYLSLKMKDE